MNGKANRIGEMYWQSQMLAKVYIFSNSVGACGAAARKDQGICINKEISPSGWWDV